VAEGDLLPGQRAFLEASRRAVRSRRRRRLALAVVAPLLAALVYGGIELNGRRELDRQVAAQVSEGRSKWEGARAKSAELDALRAKAFALFDAGEEPARQAAEEVWARALDLGLAADAEYSHASRALEGALSLDPARAAVRGLLADVTYERATLAQRSGRVALRDEVLERLSLHDASGDRRRRFDAPARLTVTISPPAEVALLRFEERGGHFELEPARRLGTTPLADLTLEQGSWVLVFTGSGRATARLPVLVGRDEELRIEIELPSAADVPDGFLYVPAGRFLFGSGDDEDVRRGFYGTVPLHEVHTGAYLVGRTEVTFGEWIAFLRDLPAEERARRTPRTRVLERNVGLFEEPDGRFRYTTQPTSQVYTALEGEMIRYPERDRRALQDWRRFPVSAISFDDALAFTAWLDAGGQVPGARLCTEHEWERAARGADGRRFSGGSHLMPDDANHDATYGRRPLAFGPDEVGSHPGSRSPVGADDMVGNVWEWTRAPTKTGEPVTKGGDWYRGELTNRTMNREISEASERSPMVGLRVCATPRRR
jgi:formylglycine-generating enzyme required for sulfatase activity